MPSKGKKSTKKKDASTSLTLNAIMSLMEQQFQKLSEKLAVDFLAELRAALGTLKAKLDQKYLKWRIIASVFYLSNLL